MLILSKMRKARCHKVRKHLTVLRISIQIDQFQIQIDEHTQFTKTTEIFQYMTFNWFSDCIEVAILSYFMSTIEKNVVASKQSWINIPKCIYLSGSCCFITIIGSVWRRSDRAAPNSLSSINSRTTWENKISHKISKDS